ncbi:MAG: prolipoprotein diacylglyceryl transferase [Anaerohalosphaeraceae bacterium]|nr:prolipoprotein diacylglyceryl transferase [Anaerohalosphaeraceae bacterium]
MHPELFRIPFTDLTVKNYGTMVVIGFLAAMYVIRKLSRGMGHNAEYITTAALYSLITGVIGARLFYVIHYWPQFSGRNFFDIFAVWKGGLELLGGVLTAICVIAMYLKAKRLPVRRYLDILAIGLLVALTFGRIGCLLNGCCFGKPTNSSLSITFPYNSLAHQSQVRPNLDRDRPLPYIDMPAEYFGYMDENNNWVDAPAWDYLMYNLKPFDMLTPAQRQEVTTGAYCPLPVIPTEIYSSICALFVAMALYAWRSWGIRCEIFGKWPPFFLRPGSTFAVMFIFYGIVRFLLEFLRDDNPFGANGLTISQNMGIGLVVFGLILIAVFARIRPDKI